jgi:hypothetical protein
LFHGLSPRESIAHDRALIGVLLRFLLLPVLAAQEPSSLQLHVIEGEGVVYPIASRATRGITVQVTDPAKRPVQGATVSFQLPRDGPGGVFATGSKTEIATTGADGRASVWGMQWNRTPGSFEVRITAAKGQSRAGTVCALQLASALAAQPAGLLKGHIGPKRGHKFAWIVLAVAGAAAGGVAASAMAGKTGPGSSPPPANTVQIGSPTIILGHP